MKAFAALALAAALLSPAALAQTRNMQPHEETAAVLQCLLQHGGDCRQGFVARASISGQPFFFYDPQLDFYLGPLQSTRYAGTETQNAYTTKFLSAMPADVYDVRFKKRELTFYVVPPGPDGNVRYIFIRLGRPDDERADLWARNPLGLF